MHLVAADARTAANFRFSPANAHDAPEGRELLRGLGPTPSMLPLLMDRADEGEQTRGLARSLGMEPAVPAKRSRRRPWAHDRGLRKRRNETERLFRRFESLPARVSTRFDKLDALYLGFLCFALIVEALRQC